MRIKWKIQNVYIVPVQCGNKAKTRDSHEKLEQFLQEFQGENCAIYPVDFLYFPISPFSKLFRAKVQNVDAVGFEMELLDVFLHLEHQFDSSHFQ